MDYLWCFIASLGAGIGTGLAGLSAATVMVPMMIVLCPSFSGKSGVYHATAIALASDILGSAFTAGIYISHRHIDLKRGWLMMFCIIGMCTVGSFAAFHVEHNVLGNFSLFLCVGIGLRFLLKPDTQATIQLNKGVGMDMKSILISLFFGLTIGFGTGFVGSGGGMMMLVVFTAFLGMERRNAVGTSTLIMTFTAAIAFISHALIDPTIILNDWPILILCLVTETIASMIAAQFANRVDNHRVNIVTGVILTILGLVMLAINYRDWLLQFPLVKCLGTYLIYLVGCIVVLLICRKYTAQSPELWRKLLHIVAFTSSIVIMQAADSWQTASICCLLFAVIVYPILQILEKWPGYHQLFSQRQPGEVKNSLLYLFVTHALLIVLCWGSFQQPEIAITAIITWGLGDMAAALVGKRYGRHPIHLPLADHHKTWEGSLAMAFTVCITGFLSLSCCSSLSFSDCFCRALLLAPVASYTELISHQGYDTISVPLVNALLLLLCTAL